ncbi:fibronectin type III domain-containing protein [Thiocapsa rosea]|nr:fibronectin type III domain-containing protein [Thiocapsa rosea]
MLRTRTLQDHPRTDIHLGFILFVQMFLLLMLLSASGLSQAAAGEVRLAWNAVNDTRAARYEVHYGTASKTYQSKVQVTTASATVSGLAGGSKYFFATRACTSDGKLCSAFSNEVNVSIPTAAQLTPTLTTPSGTANLTAEGAIDWIHWGIDRPTSVSRKASAATRIGTLTAIGGSPLRFTTTSRLAYSWTNGTPKTSATTRAGLYISGLNKGYELRVPADTNARTLTLYLGGFKTRGRIEVRLSDNSAPVYAATVENLKATFDRRLVLNYRAASAAQTLIVRYTQAISGGNVSIQAATLRNSATTATSSIKAMAEAQTTSTANTGTQSPPTTSADAVAATGPAIEIGEVEINQEWQRVELQRAFKDPVVVVKALSSYDPEPAIIRVDAIDPAGFSIRVQEWDYLDGAHDLETVSYLVMERGRHQLPDGVWVEADSLVTGTTQAFQRHLFSAPFEDAPVVFATVASFNESDAVTARLHAIETDGFDVGLREQEANAQQHLPERIDFIAWEASSGVVDGMRYEVGRTGRMVNHEAHNLVYQTAFVRPPVLVADMQTTHGDDTAALRWQNLNVESVDLRVQEEQSRDREMTHLLEDVGYFIADVE